MARKTERIQTEEAQGIPNNRVTGWLEPHRVKEPEKKKAEERDATLPSVKIFHVVPEQLQSQVPTDDTPVWQIILEAPGSNTDPLALEIHDDIILGSDGSPTNDLDVNLVTFDGFMRGVSRRHVMIRPSKTKLFIMDLRSTNGTLINGLPLGVGWAYALKHGDVISLAKLNLNLWVINKPAL